jgi:hypothetical protein
MHVTTSRVAFAILLVAACLALASAPALGASPSPGPLTTPRAHTPGQAWLDGELPVGAPAGTHLSIGALLWSPDQAAVVTAITPRFRLHPASGKAAATVANGVPDWPGHYVADVVVPPGGFGTLDIGIPGTFCDDHNVCVQQDFLFDVAVGPPVDVKLPAITAASLQLSAPTVEARSSIGLEAQLNPNVQWPRPLQLPSRLVIQVRERQGPIVLEVPAEHGGFDGDYVANIAIDKPGDYVIQLALTADATGPDLFPTALAAITVTPSTQPTAAPAVTTTGAGTAAPEWWPLALGGFGLLVAGLLFFRGAGRNRT